MSGNKCPQVPIPITFRDMKQSLLLDSLKKMKEEVQPVPVSFNCVKQELSDSQDKQHSGSQLLRRLLGDNMDIETNHALQPSPLPILIPGMKTEAQDSKFITTNLLPITKAEQIEAELSTGPSWKPKSDDINSNNISIPNNLSEITFLGMPCYYCGKESAFSWHPECHKKFSSGETRHFYCRICNRNFSSKETLKYHLNFHFPYGTFRCDLCGKVSASKAYSKKHRKIHFPKDHQCNICFKIFRNQSTLDRHQISHRPGETSKDFLCDICGYLCECIGYLNKHISNVHSHEKKYICEVCGAGTNKINKFKDHMVTHTGDKQFICAVCDKPFGRRGTLKTHIIRCHHKTMGLSKETFPCSLCDKVYQSNNGIIKHMRSHTGERNFVCDLCGKHFMHAFDLSKHKKSSIHNEELAAQQKSKGIIIIKNVMSKKKIKIRSKKLMC